MIGRACRVAAVAGALVALPSCSGAGHPSRTATASPTPSGAGTVTAPSLSTHNLAVGLRQVTMQATAELTSTSMDLQQSPTLDQAAQTLGGHAMTFSTLHTTLDQLPTFPVPQVAGDVRQLDLDLASLSATISTALAGEVSQYSRFKQQITAVIATVTRDVTTVTRDIAAY
jgi:hypothetical protein